MRLLWDLVMAVGAGLVVSSGLAWGGGGTTGGLPGTGSLILGAVVGTGYFIWRRQDPAAHESERERLERELFG